MRTVHAVLLERERVEFGAYSLHRLNRDELHEIETKSVYFVGFRPCQERIDHKLLGHGMLSRKFPATGRRQRLPFITEPVVIAGYDLLEHGFFILPVGIGVIEDNVLNHLISNFVEAAHHLSVLGRSRATVWVESIRSLRRRVMEGIVPPVVGIPIGDGANGSLLFLRGRTGVGHIGRRLRSPAFRHRTEIVSGHQVNRVHSGASELTKVGHAVRIFDREGPIGSAQKFGNGGVGGREIPHMHFQDRSRGLVDDRGRGNLFPRLRHVLRIVQIHNHGTLRIDRQPHRIGIGDQIVHHFARQASLRGVVLRDRCRGYVDLDVVQICLVSPGSLSHNGPRPVRLASHGMLVVVGCLAVGVQAKLDGLRGGCPQAKRGYAAGEGNSLLTLLRRTSVEIVEHTSGLQRRIGDWLALLTHLHHRDLARENLANIDILRRLQRQKFLFFAPVRSRYVRVEGLLLGCEAPVFHSQFNGTVGAHDVGAFSRHTSLCSVVKAIARALSSRPRYCLLV